MDHVKRNYCRDVKTRRDLPHQFFFFFNFDFLLRKKKKKKKKKKMSAIVKRPFDNAFGAPGEAHSSPFRFGAASTPSHYVTATDIVTDDVDTSTASTATTNTTNNVLSHNNSLLLTPPPMAVAKRSRFHAPAEEGDEGENASAPTTPVAPTLRGNTPFRASGSRRSIGAFSVVPKKNFQNFLRFFFFFFQLFFFC
jgi:hypothetical protein